MELVQSDRLATGQRKVLCPPQHVHTHTYSGTLMNTHNISHTIHIKNSHILFMWECMASRYSFRRASTKAPEECQSREGWEGGGEKLGRQKGAWGGRQAAFQVHTHDICSLLSLTGFVAMGCTLLYNIATAAQHVLSLINPKSWCYYFRNRQNLKTEWTGGKSQRTLWFWNLRDLTDLEESMWARNSHFFFAGVEYEMPVGHFR